MAPPFHFPSSDDASSSSTTTTTTTTTTSHSTIFSFPTPTMVDPTTAAAAVAGDATKNKPAAATKAAASTTTTITTITTAATTVEPSPQQQYICSPFSATAASFLLRRRLLLPTFVIPTLLLTVPPMTVSLLSMVAYLAGCGANGSSSSTSSSLLAILASSTAILLPTYLLSHMGISAIGRHAPNEIARQKALSQSKFALPFWSLVISIGVLRSTLYFLGIVLSPITGKSNGHNNNDDCGVVVGWLFWIWGMFSTTMYWSLRTAAACIGPAIGWTILSILVLCRYIGPFCPIVKCSCIPLRTNPLIGTLQRLLRNFTSKTRFLDFLANGLEKLSAPSPTTPVVAVNDKSGNAAKPTTGVQFTTPAMSAPPPTTASTAATDASALRLNNTDSIGRLLKYIISSANARYSRPGLLPMLVQGFLHAVGGCIFARAYILPHLGFIYQMQNHSGVDAIIVLSCAVAPTLELYSNIHVLELHYRRYSSIVYESMHDAPGGKRRRQFSLWHILIAVTSDVIHRVQRSVLGLTMLSHGIATAAVLLWSHVGRFVPAAASLSILPSPSFSDIVRSLLIAYLAVIILVSVVTIQDVLTRWAVCASGMDADVLMFQTPKSKRDEEFLVEDLIVQSVLMGDGTTVEKAIQPSEIHQPSTMKPFKNFHQDEIHRTEFAAASFAQWIEHSSTTSSGKLSMDILRMCILESLGGGGSASCSEQRQSHPFYFGDARHISAVRRRLDLSAATASPGRQPIVVPIVRALCAFAGGVGDAMSQFYREPDKTGKPLGRNGALTELWKLPPGSLNAMEFSIIAAARLVVMNSVIIDKSGHAIVNTLKRNDQLSLLLPCVLQSAFKLRCGINQYAEARAQANEINLSAYDKSGQGDGLGCYIAAEYPDLFLVLSACNDSARMAMKTLVELGDRMLEEILLRGKWKGEMRQWLLGLN